MVTLLKCFVSLGLSRSGFVYLMLEMCTDSLSSSLHGNSVNFSEVMLGLDVIFIYTITKLLPGIEG